MADKVNVVPDAVPDAVPDVGLLVNYDTQYVVRIQYDRGYRTSIQQLSSIPGVRSIRPHFGGDSMIDIDLRYDAENVIKAIIAKITLTLSVRVTNLKGLSEIHPVQPPTKTKPKPKPAPKTTPKSKSVPKPKPSPKSKPAPATKLPTPKTRF